MTHTPTTNNRLLWAYAVPYVLYVGLGLLAPETLSIDGVYGLRLLLCTAALLFFWRRYVSLRGPRSPGMSVLVGAVAGLLGLGLWILLVLPFAPEQGEVWTGRSFVLRLLAAGAVTSPSSRSCCSEATSCGSVCSGATRGRPERQNPLLGRSTPPR